MAKSLHKNVVVPYLFCICVFLYLYLLKSALANIAPLMTPEFSQWLSLEQGGIKEYHQACEEAHLCEFVENFLAGWRSEFRIFIFS